MHCQFKKAVHSFFSLPLNHKAKHLLLLECLSNRCSFSSMILFALLGWRNGFLTEAFFNVSIVCCVAIKISFITFQKSKKWALITTNWYEKEPRRPVLKLIFRNFSWLMKASLDLNWSYWNFTLSATATDKVINFKEKRAIFWNLFCAFEGIRAILTGLSVDALTTIIRLVGRRHRSFSNISITKDLPTAFAKSFFSGAMLSF